MPETNPPKAESAFLHTEAAERFWKQVLQISRPYSEQELRWALGRLERKGFPMPIVLQHYGLLDGVEFSIEQIVERHRLDYPAAAAWTAEPINRHTIIPALGILKRALNSETMADRKAREARRDAREEESALTRKRNELFGRIRTVFRAMPDAAARGKFIGDLERLLDRASRAD